MLHRSASTFPGRFESIVLSFLAAICCIFALAACSKENGKEAFFVNMTVGEHVEFYEKQGLKRMDAIKACAKDRGVPKNQVYKELL